MTDATPEPDCVLIEGAGPVRILTLNRPRTRNAIDLVVRVVLAEAIEEAMADDLVRVIVLTGHGRTSAPAATSPR